MGKETVKEKALRYIAEGRVRVLLVDPEALYAEIEVQGSRPKPYVTSCSGTVWQCKCEARLVCAHMEAGMLIINFGKDPEEAPPVVDPEIDKLLEI